MLLNSLSLTNFRNYSKADFSFSPQTTLIVGPNAVGKTNLLEAIFYLATGKSFRAGYDREVIRGGQSFARVAGLATPARLATRSVAGRQKHGSDGNTESPLELELAILANENGENTSSKRFKINGVKKRRADFVGNLRAVYFGPEEILLVTGSPSRRRKYLDSVLVQVDREYARALAEYEKVLRQRNRLLGLLREGGVKGTKGVNEQMEHWDERLTTLGSRLTAGRRELFGYFNPSAALRAGKLFLEYQPKVVNDRVLEAGREREIAVGRTLWGPHREDFSFQKNSEKLRESEKSEYSENQIVGESENQINQTFRNSDPLGMSDNLALRSTEFSEFSDLSSFGSRGEQRLAVLHLKLAELEFISERTGDRPLLLLDDIFSELDEDNRGRVLSLLGKQQTIVTATDLDQINGEKLRQHKVLQLQ